MKNTFKEITGWAVIGKDEGEIYIVGEFSTRFMIFTYDCKIFAQKFAEARNKMAKDSKTKVVPCEIKLLMK